MTVILYLLIKNGMIAVNYHAPWLSQKGSPRHADSHITTAMGRQHLPIDFHKVLKLLSQFQCFNFNPTFCIQTVQQGPLRPT
jgi:hypothetical protein